MREGWRLYSRAKMAWEKKFLFPNSAGEQFASYSVFEDFILFLFLTIVYIVETHLFLIIKRPFIKAMLSYCERIYNSK